MQNNVDLPRAATLLHSSAQLAGGTISNFVGGAITFCNVSITQKLLFFGGVAGDLAFDPALRVKGRKIMGMI